MVSATAVQAYLAGARAYARALETAAGQYQAEQDAPQRQRQAAPGPARPSTGYVVHWLAQQLGTDDPSRQLRGQAAYARSAAQPTIQGPVGAVSLLV